MFVSMHSSCIDIGVVPGGATGCQFPNVLVFAIVVCREARYIQGSTATGQKAFCLTTETSDES